MTKWRFQWIYRLLLVLLFCATIWAVWANAEQAAAPAAAESSTNNLLSRALGRLDEHALTFGLDQVPVLSENHFLGEPLWKYLASLVYVVLAFLVAKILDVIIGVWLKRWAERTETKYDDLVLELMRGPVKVVAFVIFLHVGLNLFQWPARLQELLSKALIVVVACSITYVALKVVDLLLGLWREHTHAAQDKLFAENLFPVIRKAAKFAVMLAGIVLTADNLGIKVTSLLAGLSIGGLALGLAAQDTVANLFGAVAIYLDRPFTVGDRIKVDAFEGEVESIGLRSTRVRNAEGHLVTIPNKTMGNAAITNISARPTIRTEMNIGLTYDTTPAKLKRAEAILAEIFRAHPQTADFLVSFNRFTDSTLNLLVVHFWKGSDAKAYLAGIQEINLQIKTRFEAEQIDFAFPTQTLHVKSKP